MDDVAQIFGQIAISGFCTTMSILSLLFAIKVGGWWMFGYGFSVIFGVGAVCALVSTAGEVVSTLDGYQSLQKRGWIAPLLIALVVTAWGATIIFSAIGPDFKAFMK